MESIVRQRLRWVRNYEATGDAGVSCRRCGISRPTLRLWVRRFRRDGEPGLLGLSRRPWRSPGRKLNAPERELILSLRRDRNLGARRIQSELRLLHDMELSITSVQKVLSAASVAPLRKPRRSVISKRYSRPIPGDRIQMDTMRIVPGVYQYTAVDDCSRFRVLGVYRRATGVNTLDFLARVIEKMPSQYSEFRPIGVESSSPSRCRPGSLTIGSNSVPMHHARHISTGKSSGHR